MPVNSSQASQSQSSPTSHRRHTRVSWRGSCTRTPERSSSGVNDDDAEPMTDLQGQSRDPWSSCHLLYILLIFKPLSEGFPLTLPTFNFSQSRLMISSSLPTQAWAPALSLLKYCTPYPWGMALSSHPLRMSPFPNPAGPHRRPRHPRGWRNDNPRSISRRRNRITIMDRHFRCLIDN
jgi:hypothetical protein